MIILDSPYVSEFLKNAAAELKIPVLKRPSSWTDKEKELDFLKKPNSLNLQIER